MSPRTAPDPALTIGGVPRADLLPPEIKLGRQLRRQRRGLFAAVAVVLVVVLGAYAGVSVIARVAALSLADSNARTTEILAKQQEFAKVSSANNAIAQAEAARIRATSTEIDWDAELTAILRTLPAGSTLTSVTAASSTPTTAISTPTSPLEGDRIAELNLMVTTSGIPDTATWIGDLSRLTGFVDATPSTVATSGNTVTTALVLHLDKSVLWNRFGTEATK